MLTHVSLMHKDVNLETQLKGCENENIKDVEDKDVEVGNVSNESECLGLVLL